MCVLVSAQESINKLLSEVENAGNDSLKIEAYTDIFQYYQYRAPDSAEYYLNQGLSQFRKSRNERGEAAITVLLGFLDSGNGKIAEAKKKQEYALSLFRKINYQRGIAAALGGIGVIEGKQGNYPEATKLFLEILKIYETLHDTDDIINTHLRLGVVNEKSNHLEKALQYYEGAINALEQKEESSQRLLMLYNNIGVVYGKAGNFDKALSYFEKALAKSGKDKPGFTGVRILTLNNLGIVYDRLNQDNKSLNYFKEAEQIAVDNHLQEDYIRVIINKASVIGKTNPEESIKMLSKCLEEIKQAGQKSMEADIYGALIEAYERSNNYKGAYLTLRQYKQLEDSLFDMSKTKEIMQLQAVHDLEQTNALVSRLKLESSTNKKIRGTIIGVAIVLTLFLVVMLVLYRKSQKLNEQITKREAELKKSNDIKDKLFSIIGHDLRGPIGNVPVMLQLLFDEGTSKEEQQYMLESLIVHANASIETLDKLLYWGQAQIKGLGIKPIEFRALDHIESSLELAETNAKQKKIGLTNNISDDAYIFADPSHFDFIVRNLLSNAIKFTHPGGSVTISSHADMKPGFQVFAVKDTGTGIAQEKLADIFKPFSSSTRGTADEKGTSIGLMLTKQFVTENGGEIWIETEVGKGSTFYFSLKSAKSS